jgi:hypothetical protein
MKRYDKAVEPKKPKKTMYVGDGSILEGRHVYLRKDTWSLLQQVSSLSRTAPYTVLANLIELAAKLPIQSSTIKPVPQ